MTRPKEPHKILIIRFSSIGDIVLTTPVVRALKNRFPGTEIHFLAKAAFIPVLRANPNITTIWEFKNNFRELIPRLKKERFDFIVDLHKNFRSNYVRFRLCRPSGYFNKLNIRKWLIVNLNIDCLPAIHIVDRYFQAVKPLGVGNDEKGLDYFIPPGEEVDPGSLPEDFRSGFIAFVIGGKHFTKILPEEQVIRICKGLKRPVILMGGKEDAGRARRIFDRLPGGNVLNGCGAWSINQSASLVRQAEKVITNDTGLMHIAAAFRKPIVSVWGNTVPEFGMTPYLPGAPSGSLLIAEVKGLSCRPCSKLGFEKCPKNHFRCMNDLDVDKIIGFLNS